MKAPTIYLDGCGCTETRKTRIARCVAKPDLGMIAIRCFYCGTPFLWVSWEYPEKEKAVSDSKRGQD